MRKNNVSRKKRIVRRIIWTLVLIVLLAGVGLYAYESLRSKYTVTYDSYTATTGSISNALSFSGNLALIDSATYTAASSCTVKTIYAAAGDEVEEGAKLIRMNNGDTVTADFAGRVNKLNVSEGDKVAQGTDLIQVADFKHMKVNFRVDEYDIGEVSVGQSCTVTVTAQEKRFAARIDAIDHISSSGGTVAYYTATAYVDINDEAVLPGMQVTVSITQEEAKDVVILKVDAVSFDFTNRAFVWMKDENGELVQTYITTGVSNGNYIEITDGLRDGDEVFTEVKTAETSGGLLSSLFGQQQFNRSRNNTRGGTNGNFGGGDFQGFGGGAGGFSGGAGGGNWSRPGGGN